ALVLLGWMSRSTSGTTPVEAWRAAAAVALLVPLSLLPAPWLDILPLGSAPARSLGIPLGRARFGLRVRAAPWRGAATVVTGPLTFGGLMAPHVARRAGFTRALAARSAATVAGAAIMAVADALGRTAAFPLQLPSGLTAAIVGAPFL